MSTLQELLTSIGITPETFQAFAQENRVEGAKYHAQITQFEATFGHLEKHFAALPTKEFVVVQTTFATALGAVIEAFTAWRGDHGRQ